MPRKFEPYRVLVNDVNGQRVATVISTGRKQGRGILNFDDGYWTYVEDTLPAANVATAEEPDDNGGVWCLEPKDI